MDVQGVIFCAFDAPPDAAAAAASTGPRRLRTRTPSPVADVTVVASLVADDVMAEHDVIGSP